MNVADRAILWSGDLAAKAGLADLVAAPEAVGGFTVGKLVERELKFTIRIKYMTEAALSSASDFVSRLITGSAASSISIVAIAVFALAVMRGRLQIRRSVEIVIGIFVIFGAPMIAAGLSGANPAEVDMLPPALPTSSIRTAPPTAAVYDPYAGASVPQNRASSDILVPVQ